VPPPRPSFAKAVTSETAYSIDWFSKAGLPPTTKSGLADTTVSGDKYTTDFASRIGANSSADQFWVYPQFAQIEVVLATAVQGILIGKSSPKDGLAAARDQMTALTK